MQKLHGIDLIKCRQLQTSETDSRMVLEDMETFHLSQMVRNECVKEEDQLAYG